MRNGFHIDVKRLFQVLLVVAIVCIVSLGCKKKDKDDPIPVMPEDGPSAGFIASPLTGEAPLQVQFYDASTGEEITDWSWDFDNDGTPDSTNQSPLHTYTNPGWYTVSLTVTNAEGSDTCTKEQYILVAASIWYVNCAVTALGDGTSLFTAFKTIQEGLTAASSDHLVLVSNGTYQGAGNKDLDFAGKSVYLKSSGGSTYCIIDCESSGRGVHFYTNETEDAVVDGFTITNGSIADKGGAIFCNNGACPTIANCNITSNSTTSNNDGGGIALRYSSDATVRNCVITGNTGYAGGGVSCDESDATFTDCKINSNTSTYSGGGVHCEDSSPTFTDCEIKSNTKCGIRGDTSSPTFTNCIIEGNTGAAGGGGNFSYGGGPLFVGCKINGNTATSGDGGGIRLFATKKTLSQAFVNCLIQNNSATSDGGGIALDDQAKPILINCVITGNTAGGDGGGVWLSYRCDAHFINCVVANNSSTGNGGGLCPVTDTDIVVDNSIIWGNAATGLGNQIYALSTGMPSTATLNYCNYANGTGDIHETAAVIATACKSLDPAFTDGVFHIHPFSTCKNSGSNALVPGGITTDLDGNDRIVDTVDMGAYELK